MLSTLPPSPLSRYKSRNAGHQNSGSARVPSAHTHHMLSARWMMPKWRNVEVRSRHGSPLRVRGPKSAPQRSKASPDGSITETPATAVAMKTATLRLTRRRVMIGRGSVANDGVVIAYSAHPQVRYGYLARWSGRACASSGRCIAT